MKISNLFKTQKVDDEDWPKPESLRNTLQPVNPLLPSNIPEPFHDWVMDVAERMQCPHDFLAVTTMIITASLVGAGCGIKPKQKDDWLVLPNLWGGIVSRPGMLKTPAVSEAMQLLNQLEVESKKYYDEEYNNYLVKLDIYKIEKDAIKNAIQCAYKQDLKCNSNDMKDAGSLKEQLINIKEPDKPIWNRFKTNDAIIEKLSELLAENPRGLLLYRDELIGLLSSWDKDGRESDRAFFLEAWNGYGSLTTDRISRGTVHTENLCISIFGTTQPAKLARYLHQAIRGNDNDGLLQRFQLLIYADQKNDWKLIDKPPNLNAKKRASEIFKRLAKMSFTDFGATKESDDRFPYFRFDDEGQELFYVWLTKLEQEKLNLDDQPILIEHLAKYRSLMPSLALLFYLIDLASGKNEKQITLDHALSSICWCEYLEKHARRIYGLVNDITSQAVNKLAHKIKTGAITSPFSIRDVYRKEWAFLDEKDIVQKACEELVEAGWLRIQAHQNEIGRPKLPIYIVNPMVNNQRSIN